MLREVGPYRLLNKLGAGGMGEVHLAQHQRSGQRCALKLLRPGDPDEALRFVREGQAHVLAGVHPHLVEIYELGQHAGWSYIALELVEGGDLQARLRERGALELAEATRLCQQACRGVEHLHRLGILHRDLKPANVLLTSQGEAKVTDFGLARLSGAETLTRSGELLGTPLFMAPEQARGEVESYGPATDVYGLGGVLYACLTGRSPTTSRGSLYATLAAINEELPPPPSTINSAVPPWLDAVCLRALAKRPGERYASAGELAAALEESAPPSSAPGARRWLAAALLALGALALGYFGSAGPPAPGGGPERADSPASPGEPSPGEPRPAASALSAAAKDEGLGARCERMVARIAAADPRDRVALQLELLRLCHQRHQVALLAVTAQELSQSPHALEAAYRLADAKASSAECEEAHEALRRMGARADAWGALARARLQLEGALSPRAAREHVDALERSLARAPGPEQAALLQQMRELLSSAVADSPEQLRIEPADAPDVRALLPAAQAYAYAMPGSAAAARELERLLERAKRLCRPADPPPELRALGLRLEAERGLRGEVLSRRARELALELSPWRRARLCIVAGLELEERGAPLEAFELWQQAPPKQTRDWLRSVVRREAGQGETGQGETGRELEPTLCALALRLERAIGEPFSVPLPEGAPELVDLALRDLPAGSHPLARGALELALRGASWSQLEPEVEELLTRGNEEVLLALELIFARDQLERAANALKQTGARLTAGTRDQSNRLALLLAAFAGGRIKRERVELQPHAAALARAVDWTRRGDSADRAALRETLRAAEAGPGWARRLAAYVTQLNYPLEARREGQRLPGALYGRAYFFERLQELRVAKDLASLERAALALRNTSYPTARIALAQVTLLELSPRLRQGFLCSLYLWLKEAQEALSLRVWTPLRVRSRPSLLLATGLLRLHDGGAAKEVRGIWRSALQGQGLPAALEEVFQARFGEPFAR